MRLARLTPASVALTAFAGLLAPGCVHEVDDGAGIRLESEITTEVKEAVIVGDVNWQDASTLSGTERQNANAVGHLNIPAKGTRCTAFLVADDLVMTNHHCISRQSHAEGARVSFRKETGVALQNQETYRCDTFIGANEGLDYALLRCVGTPGATHGVLPLNEGNPRNGDGVYVVHQNCDYFSNRWCDPTKKLSPGNITRTGTELQYNADTLGGSSGSPVFNALTHEVIGLHHVGIGGNSSGRGWANGAVRIDRIVDDISANWPSLTLGAGTAAPAPVVDTADALEPNNGRSQASVAQDGAAFADLSITASDSDVFRIDLDGAAQIDVQVDFAHAAGDLDVAIYTGNSEQTVATGVSADDDETVSVSVVQGPVYVVVYGYDGATNDYAISFDVTAESIAPGPGDEPTPTEDPVETPAPVDAPDFAEPNNSRADASDLPFPGSVSGVAIDSAGDIDFYRVVHAGGRIDIQLDFTHADGDLDLFMYSEGGSQLADSQGVTNQERIAGTLAAGTYFIRVIGYGSATGAYSLTAAQ